MLTARDPQNEASGYKSGQLPLNSSQSSAGFAGDLPKVERLVRLAEQETKHSAFCAAEKRLRNGIRCLHFVADGVYPIWLRSYPIWLRTYSIWLRHRLEEVNYHGKFCLAMNQEPVVLACAANPAYAIPLAVMLRSAADHLSPDRELVAWVVDDGLGDEARQRIVDSLPGRATVRWLPTSRSRFLGLPLWGRMPLTTYHKLTIAESLPPNLSKAIWLDCDMLVLADLAELWELPIGDSHALAVTDALVPTVSSRFGVSGYSELGLEPSSPYFNAGMMVLNTVRWRTSKVGAAALSYLERFHKRVFFWDQEALNAVLAGRWTQVDPRWNWSANLDRLSERRPAHDARNERPRIVHFSGNIKPWVVREAMDFDAIYFRVLDETAWRGWRPERTLARSVLGWYGSSRLRRVVYPAEQWGMHVLWRVTRR